MTAEGGKPETPGIVMCAGHGAQARGAQYGASAAQARVEDIADPVA